MSTSELPVYRETYRLVSLITDLTMQFPRSRKHTFGQKIETVSLDLFEYIHLANTYVANRAMYLEGFQVKFELLKTLIRLCTDKKIITISQAAELAELTTKIGKQISGWKNSTLKSQRS